MNQSNYNTAIPPIYTRNLGFERELKLSVMAQRGEDRARLVRDYLQRRIQSPALVKSLEKDLAIKPEHSLYRRPLRVKRLRKFKQFSI